MVGPSPADVKRFIVGLAMTAVLAITAQTYILAQAGATGQISGVVRDESGGVLPGVDVTATQTDTGFKRTAITDAEGLYTLPALPTGPYRIDAMLSGFKAFQRAGVTLQVNGNLTIAITLSLGALSETVSVTGAAPLIETRNMGVGQVMDNERINQLPLNGRNTAELVQYAPAALPAPNMNANARAFNGTQGGLAFSVAGSLPNAVGYTLDGAPHNNPYNNLNLPLPFPDALQEFKVETSALTAQNGVHAGAAVNAVSKSGTNQTHGNVFEFARDHRFNATNPFNAVKNGKRQDDGLNRNQYGGTIGGPIIHDRLFYFAGYQGTRTRQTPSDAFAFVPTAAMLQGDFTAFASAACNAGRALTLRTPFVNNQVAPSQFSPAARAISAKLPTTTDPCGRVQYTTPVSVDESQSLGKVDFQLSPNQSLFGRYIATSLFQPPPYEKSGNLLTTNTGGTDNLAQSFTAGHNWVLSSKALNSFRFAFNRTAIDRTNSDFFGPQDVGINIFSYLPKYTTLSVTNGFSFGPGTQAAAVFHTNSYHFTDDITKVSGAHEMATGVSLVRWNTVNVANVRSAGNLTVDGSALGAGLADFLLGRLTQLQQSAPNTLYAKETYLGLYGQDTWRVSSRLTVNYGARWEPYFPQQLFNNQVYNFDPGRFQQGVKSQVYVNAPAGVYYPGDQGFPGQSGFHKSWTNIGPRVGMSWDPTGSGRTSVRASYGRAFDFVSGGFYINEANAPPWGSEIRIQSPPGGLDNPFVGSGVTNFFPTQQASSTVPFSLFGSYISTQYNMKNPVSDLWNAVVERQIGSNWAVSAGYIGSHTSHVWETQPLNNGDPTVTSVVVDGVATNCGDASLSTFQSCMNRILNNRRPLYMANPAVGQYYGPVDQFVTDGWQRYNGLLLSLTRRSARGAALNANYTLSHCYGAPSGNGGTNSPNLGNGYNDPKNHALDNGNCDTDRRHVFTLTASVQSPDFSGHAWSPILAGWRLAGGFRALSGPWFSVAPGNDRAMNGQTGTQRVNQISDNPYGDMSIDPANGGKRFLNPAAFAQPALGTLGTMQRNSIEGLGSKNLDLQLTRLFHIAGAQTVELRAEAFNAMNWFQWLQPGQTSPTGAPTLNLSSQTFGEITAAGDPRIMQFAVRYGF
jgi:hypothetical protein